MDALYFSLSTMTTIGYGVSDYYFGGCWTPLLLVLLQVCFAITFDACAVGLLFTRLSRGRKRSKTVVVSNQAVVQVVQGIPYLMVRVGELRRFPLINASVRLFCIRHERIPRFLYPILPRVASSSSSTYESLASPTVTTETPSSQSQQQQQQADYHPRTATIPSSLQSTTKKSDTTTPIPIETTHFVTRVMKLWHHHHDDSNSILMSLPQVIVHRMDETSPLVPPSEWYDAQGYCHPWPPPNPEQWLDVQQYALQEFWKDRRLEIVVLVEGTDELTGAAIQTRHSYMAGPATTCNNNNVNSNTNRHDNNNNNNNANSQQQQQGDVVWNRAFVNCILPYHPHHHDHHDEEEDEEEFVRNSSRYHHPVCTVDFARFHDTVSVPRDCLASPYVPY
jgi:Inward rectifier potassium channel transmembrane domain